MNRSRFDLPAAPQYADDLRAIDAPSLASDFGKPDPEQVVEHYISHLTVDEALAIQRWQLEALEVVHPGITASAARVTNTRLLEPGKEYPVTHLDQYVPRGRHLLQALGLEP